MWCSINIPEKILSQIRALVSGGSHGNIESFIRAAIKDRLRIEQGGTIGRESQKSRSEYIPVAEDKPAAGRLKVIAGQEVGKAFAITGKNAVLTRAELCKWNKLISRVHARIFLNEDSFWIEDMNSQNGTYVNDNRIMEPTGLSDGDRISIGGITLLFQTPLTKKRNPSVRRRRSVS